MLAQPGTMETGPMNNEAHKGANYYLNRNSLTVILGKEVIFVGKEKPAKNAP